MITELRLSLFELRSEVDRHGGLAAAIAEYARTVGASGGLRVHLSLDESTARLPAATEAELLRIAQEAITNARKHAGAPNLWVTCEVDPPYAQIEVSDDGHGIGDQRPDGRLRSCDHGGEGGTYPGPAGDQAAATQRHDRGGGARLPRPGAITVRGSAAARRGVTRA